MKVWTIYGIVLALNLLAAARAAADEGMWLFNKPPEKYLKDKHGFEFPRGWLDHVQKSSVRFNSGGSGSFVSADGLVMTNHHVGADALQKFSDEDNTDYLKNGFHARTHQQEKKCLDLELNVLMSIEDVTDKVKGAVTAGLKPEEAFRARQKVIAEIQKESLKKTGLRSDVVTLYQGGQYHLYRYKRYTDVRLVFAPEKQAAFFGGDPDNFEYPRYDLDITFFRVYENDKPVHPEHYLKWSKEGAADNELVFVSGHPGKTDRLNVMDELHYLRDIEFPFRLQRLFRMEVLLSNYSERSASNRRKAEEFYFGVANSRKARKGVLAGLLDPELMGRKAEQEQKLKAAVEKDEKLGDVKEAWKSLADIQKVRARALKPFTVWEGEGGFTSELFHIARTLVRAAEELPKADGERLREFHESGLPSLKLQLFSEAKIFDDYETLKLADGLTFLCEQIGADNPLVKKVLAGKSPSERAYELVKGSKLKDVEVRKKLYEGGKKAVDNTQDSMIELAKLVDDEARKWRKLVENQVEEPRTQAYAKIARAKYAVEGDSTYPDATFTLRLAFGKVKGYEENGKKVPFETTFEGMYKRSAEHENRDPFDLPKRWLEKKDKLDLKTPLNFVCTADIIGGNSGSPVVNRKGELVGIIFDGNIQSLVLDVIYTEDVARAVSVHSAGILEALNKVFDASELVEEIVGKKQ